MLRFQGCMSLCVFCPLSSWTGRRTFRATEANTRAPIVLRPLMKRGIMSCLRKGSNALMMQFTTCALARILLMRLIWLMVMIVGKEACSIIECRAIGRSYTVEASAADFDMSVSCQVGMGCCLAFAWLHFDMAFFTQYG